MGTGSNNKLGYKHLCGPSEDTLARVWWDGNRLEGQVKSRPGPRDREGVREICLDVAEILDAWKPDEECESGAEFVYDLADHLGEYGDWEVEVQPETPYGIPNILLGDKLALELEINPDKGERGRAVSRCANYSGQWETWIILIGAGSSTAGHLNNLLVSEGLERILVWNFPQIKLD